jgi:hypothetical protein
MPEIEIIVTPDGQVTLEALGAAGAGCLDLTRRLEEALGQVESRFCKTEYWQEEVTLEQNLTSS